MRGLLLAGSGRLADPELRAMMLIHLRPSSPATIQSLTPERPRALLRREGPRSILNS